MQLESLEKTFAALQEFPPAFRVFPERKSLLMQMDMLYGEADSERSYELGRFYRNRLDEIFAGIAAYDGKEPRLWKLYSSGVIIKDARRTIAMDINNGCLPMHGRSAVKLTVEDCEKIADLADEYYVSHAHDDHVSPQLCDAFTRRKKLVVMPRSALKGWMVDGGVAAEELDTPDTLTFLNWQGNAAGGMDCAMYLFTLSNGKTIFSRGDIYHKEGFEGCLEAVKKSGKRIDYACLSPYFTSGDDPVDILDRDYRCRFLNFHEWEFAHRPMGKAGEATQCFETLFNEFAAAYADNRLALLTWGESITLD